MGNKSWTEFLLFTDCSLKENPKTEIMLLWLQAVLIEKRGHKIDKKSKAVRQQINGTPAAPVVIL